VHIIVAPLSSSSPIVRRRASVITGTVSVPHHYFSRHRLIVVQGNPG
jgi:hypothetical protein